jgi:outer membrane protein TolC
MGRPGAVRGFAGWLAAAAAAVAVGAVGAGPAAAAEGESAAAPALTERDVVTRALSASPTLRAAVLERRAAAAGLRAEEAAWTPIFYAAAEGGHSETLGASLQGVAPNRRDSVRLESGVTIPTAVGTSVDVGVVGSFQRSEVTRDPTTDRVLDLGAVYGAEARAVVRQPLLRGLGRDVGEADLRAAQAGRDAAEESEAETASALLRDVLTAYWDLWYAQETVAVDTAALALAERQRDEAAERAAKLGTVAETDALRFDSEAAALAAELARAEADREARALTLAGLLGLTPAEGRALRADPAAIAAPLVVPEAPAAELPAAAARESRELRALAAEVARAREQLRPLVDARRPTLDLEATLSVGGLWNDDTITTLGLPDDRPAVTALVGLRFELPVRSTRADAELARAQYAVEAAEARLLARAQTIEAQAAAQGAQLAAALRRVGLAERSEAVAARLAAAEEARLALGLSTPLQVVEAREQQRTAALGRLRAAVEANTAAIAVAHQTGALLALGWEAGG